MSLGFYVDLASCIGCKTCQVACKDRRDIQVAGPRLRRVDTFECGTYPEVAMFHLNISCNHCESPACVANCPTGAMYKGGDGTVQHDDEACIGCQTCVNSCPYGAPQFIEEDKIVQKCEHLPGAARGGARAGVRGGVPHARHRVWRNGRFARRPSRCGERAALHGACRHDDPEHSAGRQPRGPARGLQSGRSVNANAAGAVGAAAPFAERRELS